MVGGTLYVCDTFDNELLAVELASGAVRTLTRELEHAGRRRAGPDGALYVADYGNGRIARVTTAGQATTWATPLGANGVAVAPDGTVYATERERLACCASTR